MTKRNPGMKKNPRGSYDTPPKAILPLLPYLKKDCRYAEPCAGKGLLIEGLKAHGFTCGYAGDIAPRAKSIQKRDALTLTAAMLDRANIDLIITNTPWTIGFLDHSCELIDDCLNTGPGDVPAGQRRTNNRSDAARKIAYNAGLVTSRCAHHGGVYRGGVYRGAAVRRGVAVGVGAAAVGAAAFQQIAAVNSFMVSVRPRGARSLAENGRTEDLRPLAELEHRGAGIQRPRGPCSVGCRTSLCRNACSPGKHRSADAPHS